MTEFNLAFDLIAAVNFLIKSMAMLEMRQRLWPKFQMGNPNFHRLLVNSYPTNLKIERQTQQIFSLVTQCNDSHLHLKT